MTTLVRNSPFSETTRNDDDTGTLRLEKGNEAPTFPPI